MPLLKNSQNDIVIRKFKTGTKTLFQCFLPLNKILNQE